MRTVLAAAAIAKGSGKKCPVLQPVGLHFRVRHHYRTDMWVEFAEPYYLPEDDIPDDLIQAVQKREWVEPPGDLVRSLRWFTTSSCTDYAQCIKLGRAWRIPPHRTG